MFEVLMKIMIIRILTDKMENSSQEQMQHRDQMLEPQFLPQEHDTPHSPRGTISSPLFLYPLHLLPDFPIFNFQFSIFNNKLKKHYLSRGHNVD